MGSIEIFPSRLSTEEVGELLYLAQVAQGSYMEHFCSSSSCNSCQYRRGCSILRMFVDNLMYRLNEEGVLDSEY